MKFGKIIMMENWIWTWVISFALNGEFTRGIVIWFGFMNAHVGVLFDVIGRNSKRFYKCYY